MDAYEKAGLDTEHAQQWRDAGFTPRRIKAWYGETTFREDEALQAARYRDLGLTPTQAEAWHLIRLDHDPKHYWRWLFQWVRNGWTPDAYDEFNHAIFERLVGDGFDFAKWCGGHNSSDAIGHWSATTLTTALAALARNDGPEAVVLTPAATPTRGDAGLVSPIMVTAKQCMFPLDPIGGRYSARLLWRKDSQHRHGGYWHGHVGGQRVEFRDESDPFGLAYGGTLHPGRCGKVNDELDVDAMCRIHHGLPYRHDNPDAWEAIKKAIGARQEGDRFWMEAARILTP